MIGGYQAVGIKGAKGVKLFFSDEKNFVLLQFEIFIKHMIIKLYNGNPNVREVRRIADTLRDGGVVILPKSTKPERMAQNKDLFDFTLTDEEMEQITAKSLDHSEIINHFDPKLVQFLNRRNIHD